MAWLNSDDLYLPGTLHLIAQFFQEHPEVYLVYGDQIDIDGNGCIILSFRSLNFNRWALLARGMGIPQPTVFFRKCVFLGAGSLDESLYWEMNCEYMLRIAFGSYIIKTKPQATGHVPSTLCK